MRQRRLEPEMMDDPEIPVREHRCALQGLARLNRLSGAAQALWPSLLAHARARGKAISVLDVATGSGDIPIALAHEARRAGVVLDLRACDRSRVALDAAAERARAAGVQASLTQRDVVASGLGEEDQSIDLVTCSLFLHHLTEEQVVGVLREMGRVARGCVLICDLRRCDMGLTTAYVASRLMTRSRVVHVDAVRSVRAAFTADELDALAARAGMEGARIRRVRPFRMLLTWAREQK